MSYKMTIRPPIKTKNLIIAISLIVALVLFIAFIIWLVIHPASPSFTLQDAFVEQFDTADKTTLTTVLHVSVVSRNPNTHAGIFYEQLNVYAAYRNQPITLSATMPRSYQGHKQSTMWSPELSGAGVPISPDILFALALDESAGNLVITVLGEGRVRFKIGTWVSGQFRIMASCSAYFQFEGGVAGGVARLRMPTGCNVEISA